MTASVMTKPVNTTVFDRPTKYCLTFEDMSRIQIVWYKKPESREEFNQLARAAFLLTGRPENSKIFGRVDLRDGYDLTAFAISPIDTDEHDPAKYMACSTDIVCPASTVTLYYNATCLMSEEEVRQAIAYNPHPSTKS